jgi:TPR repeat protein
VNGIEARLVTKTRSRLLVGVFFVLVMAGCATRMDSDLLTRAKNGDARAQAELGWNYENGFGVVEDDVAAV